MWRSSIFNPVHTHPIFNPVHIHSIFNPVHTHPIFNPVHTHPIFNPVHTHPISLQSILISSYLCLGLPCHILPSNFPISSPFASLFYPILPHASLISSSYTDHSHTTRQGQPIMKLLITQFSPASIASSLSGPNILLSILFLDTLIR